MRKLLLAAVTLLPLAGFGAQVHADTPPATAYGTAAFGPAHAFPPTLPREIEHNGALGFLIPADYKNVFVDISGEIKPDDGDKLAAWLKFAADNFPNAPVWVHLNSPGGNVAAAATMASAIAKAHATVTVAGTCASACFFLLTAGVEKWVTTGSRIGVHSASNLNGDEDKDVEAVTMTVARILRNAGVPNDIIGRMVTTPPAEMAWLTTAELNELHVRWMD